MTPFGIRLRDLRAARNETQAAMAAELDVSPAYLSALERGRRGTPSFAMLQRITAHFGLIWDEAEELARLAALSDPRVVVDTQSGSADATRAANLLAELIGTMDEKKIAELIALLES